MLQPRHIPKVLAIVAVLFLIEGVAAAVKMVVLKLTSGGLLIDLDVLCIPASFGLRRFSRGWRTFALFCIWMDLIGASIFFFVGFTIKSAWLLDVAGIPIGYVPPFALPVACALFFILSVWQYRVLTRPDIRALFFAGQ